MKKGKEKKKGIKIIIQLLCVLGGATLFVLYVVALSNFIESHSTFSSFVAGMLVGSAVGLSHGTWFINIVKKHGGK